MAGDSSSPAASPIQTTKVARYPSAKATTTDPVQGAEDQYQSASKPESYADVEKRIVNSYSSEIAAIRANSAAQLAAQDPLNKANEGRTRAASAGSGTLGTDFGNGEMTEAEKASQRANDLIRTDAQAKEGAITSKAGEEARADYNTERTTGQAALKDKIGYAKDAVSQVQSKIQTIAAATKLDDLSQNEYDSLYAHSGFNSPEEFNAFFEAAHTAALQGTKLVGDATTGYYVPQIDPATGGLTYKNVIKPIVKPTQYGAYEWDPTSGEVKTIAQAQPKIMTSGGRIWSIDPKTNKAVPLTARVAAAAGGKVGYEKANLDQQLAVHAWIESEAEKSGRDASAYLTQVKTDPNAFMEALNGALQSGIYVPAAVSQDSTDTSAADASAANAAQAAQDAADAAANSAANGGDGGGDGTL